MHKIPVELWQELTLAGVTEKVKWLSIIKPKSYGAPIGLTSDGEWAIPTSEGVKKIELTESGTPLLVALEYPLDELRKILFASLQAYGISKELTDNFPYEQTIQAALHSGIENWAQLALSWLESDSSLLTYEVKLQLKKLIEKKSLSQKIRQHAKKLCNILH